MVVAIILAGGVGARMHADTPKQFIRVQDRLLITYCLETLIRHSGIDGIQIVADQEWQKLIFEDLEKNHLDAGKILGFSKPGKMNRQESIFHGLQDIKNQSGFSTDSVLICDAARPNMTASMISACLNSLQDHDGAMPVLPMKDTLYFSEDGKSVSSLMERQKIFAGQAPEAFSFEKYYDANARLTPEQMSMINGSTEPAILAGMDIAMIPGDEQNYKITTPADLERFCRSVSGPK
ncbi:MAG: 2-C-methyl-D-erythritol 4-phosphate cytidylyltransferase [Lachnospiraceae bacterium]|nr:2-C-methyl-D-erythritol 4-phosphate cytidylyltransferase [Lachnospiraceae bacterium]